MALRPREMKRLIAENEKLKNRPYYGHGSEEFEAIKKANIEGSADFTKLQAENEQLKAQIASDEKNTELRKENEALKKGASPVASSAYNAIIAENKALLKKNKAYEKAVKEYKKTLKEFEKQNKELRKRLEGLLTESPSPESKQENKE